MSSNNAEYGAIHGMTMEWTEADLAASKAQQASMDAQRVSQERGKSWQALPLGERAILAAAQANEETQDA